MGLEQLKMNYLVIHKKYGLPSFQEINEDFHIERIAEAETELLPAEVRRWMWEKYLNYMRFLEGILNPVNATIFIFSIIKTLSQEDKKRISEIYKKLMKEEINVIKLDLEFDEKKEAEFIKRSYKMWQEIKKQLSDVLVEAEKKFEIKQEENSKGYFG